MGGRGQVLEDGVPELSNRKDIYCTLQANWARVDFWPLR